MSDSIRLSSVAVNCPDAARLAAFYADITGGQVTSSDASWATVNGPGGRIDFQTVPGYTPPAWPEPTAPNHLHLDFLVDDLAAAEAGCWPRGPPGTSSSPTPATAWCSPTPAATRSA